MCGWGVEVPLDSVGARGSFMGVETELEADAGAGMHCSGRRVYCCTACTIQEAQVSQADVRISPRP